MMSISAVSALVRMYKEDIEMGNGAQCGCGQWIHEDCIGGSTVIGSDGTE